MRQPPLQTKPADLAREFQQAVLAYQRGHLDEAAALCGAILQQEPRHVDALHLQGVLHYQKGQLTEAVHDLEAAHSLQPSNVAVLSALALVQAKLGQFAGALSAYDRVLAQRPDDAAAFTNRGNVLMALKRPADALSSYDKALALKPQLADALYNRGNAFRDLGRLEEALASYDKVLALAPDNIAALNNRANVLEKLGRPNEALVSFDKVLGLAPSYAEGYGAKANILIELGRLDAARDAIETAIKLAPRTAHFYHLLCECKKFVEGDPHLCAMQELAKATESLAIDAQISLDFSLGKALADIGDTEGSLRHYCDGNALKRSQISYDAAADRDLLARTQAFFTAEAMHERQGLGDPSRTPIFILGMPRSGTTLIEQILASHPHVFGAGEIDEFKQAALAFRVTREGSYSPEAFSRMGADQWQIFGADYVARIRKIAPAARFVTNKTPENFRFVGLIHLALPNARIIHLRRDPIDTCLSCFTRLFGEDNLPYTYDLAELGRYYRAYESLMAHWRNILPPNVMLEVQYEAVVADLEGAARRVLAHCGLEWDPRCLDFHKTERAVHTSSRAQVRQPLYKSAVGRWRSYEAHLGPLLAALEQS